MYIVHNVILTIDINTEIVKIEYTSLRTRAWEQLHT